MRLKTLGGMVLKGATFTEHQPLLMLCYIACKGSVHYGELRDLFWPYELDKTKKIKNLSDRLGHLKDFVTTYQVSGKKLVKAKLELDAAEFQEAIEHQDYEHALSLYTGTFLHLVEETKHWKIGEELGEWIDTQRKRLQGYFVHAALLCMQQYAANADYITLRQLLERVLALPMGIREFSLEELQRLRKICQVAGLTDLLTQVQEKEEEIYEALSLPSHNLLGREALLKDISTWLRDGEQALVLWGQGGIGKTVLAKECLELLGVAFEGAHFLPLESLDALSSEEDVLRELGLALSLSAKDKDSIWSAMQRKLLLVIDNVEQLVHLKPLFQEMIAACPDLTVVFTSRGRLSFGRHVEIPPLTLGESLALLKREGLSSCDQAQLQSLCQLLGGLPLALKLAAFCLRTYPLANLLQDLHVDLYRLTHSKDRHGSIQDVIKVSLQRLKPKEQQALQSLTVFEAGFTLEAAQVVSEVSAETLKTLVDSALLHFDMQKARYGFHPVIKTCLGRHGDRAVHAEYFFAMLLEDASLLLPELANLEKAWVYALDAKWFDEIEQALPALRSLVDRFALSQFALKLCQSLEAVMPVSLAGTLAAEKAWLYLRQGEYKPIKALSKEALQSKVATSTRLVAFNALGAAYDLAGEFAKAKEVFQEALGVAENDKERNSVALNLLVNRMRIGDYAEAEHYLERAKAMHTSFRWRYLQACLFIQKDPLKALLRFNKLLEDATSQQDRHWQLQVKPKLAQTYLALNQAVEAQKLAKRLCLEARQLALRRVESVGLRVLGDSCVALKNYDEAANSYKTGLKLVQSSGNIPVSLGFFLRILHSKVLAAKFAKDIYTYCFLYQDHMLFEDLALLKNLRIKHKDQGALKHLDLADVAQLVCLQLESQELRV